MIPLNSSAAIAHLAHASHRAARARATPARRPACLTPAWGQGWSGYKRNPFNTNQNRSLIRTLPRSLGQRPLNTRPSDRTRTGHKSQDELPAVRQSRAEQSRAEHSLALLIRRLIVLYSVR